MRIIEWELLPPEMKNERVRKYYDVLVKRRMSLLFKRVFDVVVASCILVILSPFFLILAIVIKLDSKGPVFYRQVRITQYNRPFRIFKFRTMIQGADKGSQVTLNSDSRVTRIGKWIRKFRLDELCQLIDIVRGTMTFVGTRPEVPKYTEQYTDEMLATFLLPAGVTSLASIYYKDEAKLLDAAKDTDQVYVQEILPAKMHFNLKALEEFSLWNDVKILFMTVLAVLGKEYKEEHDELHG